MSKGILQRKCSSCGNHTIAGGKCEDCKDKKGILQRKSADNSEHSEVPPIVHEVLRSSGQPLDKSTRAFFEPRFAHNFSSVPVSSTSQQMSHSKLIVGEPGDVYEQEADRVANSIMLSDKNENKISSTNAQHDEEQDEKFDLSQVRIHTDIRAAESASAVNALAYTVGHNIVFGAGRFSPSSREGRRLIAHELTHTVQQGGGSRNGARTGNNVSGDTLRLQRQPTDVHSSPSNTLANRAMKDNVPSEKWSEQVEAVYRHRGDPRADAILRCRTQGVAACAWLLTPSEVDALHALAVNAKGDEKSIQSGLKNAAPLLGLLGPMPLVAPALAPSTTLAPAIAAPGGAAGGAAVATIAAPVVMIAYLAVAGYFLYKLAQFQQGLREKGYVILDEALAVCIGGCHSPQSLKTLPRWDDFDLAPSPHRQKPMDDKEMRRWLEQQPTPQLGPKTVPQPIPKPDADFDDEDTTRRCRAMAVGQRGGNSCHDQFATLISGSPREWGIETPESQYRDFDGLGHGRMLYEVKTGYRFLLGNAASTQQMRANTIAQFVEQSSAQSLIAKRCNYSLLWVFNDKRVADFVSGFIEPNVISQKYDCDENR